MSTSKASGTQAATLNTEHTLATITDAGSYLLKVDTNAMALGEDLTVREYEKVLSGGTTRLARTFHHTANGGDLVTKTIPLDVINEAQYSIEQTSGTGRSFPWEVSEL